MLNNYFKIFVRNLLKHRTASIINVAGLGLAIAACVFILLFVFDELKYDRFNENLDRIYRYTEQSKTTGERALIIPACNFSMITDNLPEFESGFRLLRNIKETVNIGENAFIEDIWYADNAIFEVMTFPLVTGDPKTVLKEPFSIVISETMANKYFGNINPVGKTIGINNENDFKITGVMKEIPENSHIRPSIIASIETFNTTNPRLMQDWHISSCFFYFLVKPNISPEQFETKISERVKEKYGDDWTKTGRVVLQPLKDIYLYHSGSPWDISKHGAISIIRSFIIIALLILLMASFNYTNMLTTSIKIREKEIAIRTILGAGRTSILIQLVIETVLYLLISFGLAVMLIGLLMYEFNRLTDKTISLKSLLSVEIILSVIGLILLTAAFSLVYPAFFTFRGDTMSKLRTNINSKNYKLSGFSFGFRQIVTGLQFIITIGLLISVVVISHQLKYANNARLGFNKEHLLVIENPWDDKMYNRFEDFRNKITQYPQIVSVSASGNNPSENINNYTFIYIKGKNPNEAVKVAQIAIDYDLFKTWQAKFLQGRDFSREITSDRAKAVIINNAAVKVLKLSQPINTIVNGVNNAENDQTIIGVVEDIHFKSFREPVPPILFYLRPWSSGNIVIRLTGNDIPETVKLLETEWKQIMPKQLFKYKFIDESFDRLYRSEQNTEILILVFSAFAMIISLMGVFGLLSLISQTKRKEIGVRKVLGASVPGIVYMIIKEYIYIVIGANVIAWPVAYYIMTQWLQEYAYRIPLSWDLFVYPSLFTLLIALVTIISQATRAALTNPVDSLKYE